MNPIFLVFLKSALPYLVAAIAGFSLAFGIQELRITHVEQEYAQYKIDQQLLIQHQIDQANLQRKKATDDYVQTKAALEKSITAGDVYRRCVAAGKCGVQRCPSGAVPGIPTSGEPDGISADAVPLTPGDTAINDCAVTTLMLNKLQSDIENQEGYR